MTKGRGEIDLVVPPLKTDVQAPDVASFDTRPTPPTSALIVNLAPNKGRAALFSEAALSSRPTIASLPADRVNLARLPKERTTVWSSEAAPPNHQR
jgi:hypothetical protein